jgi:LSD1 subclass zinc finger protein
MIAPSLLEILVCPACRQRLALKDNGETLKCAACHRAYPVRDDIPILLIDEARIETS